MIKYIGEKAIKEPQTTSNVENTLNNFLNTNTNNQRKENSPDEKDKLKNTVKRNFKVDIKALGIPRMDSSLREQFRALALIDMMKRPQSIKIE